jgi:hypothetical protein
MNTSRRIRYKEVHEAVGHGNKSLVKDAEGKIRLVKSKRRKYDNITMSLKITGI